MRVFIVSDMEGVAGITNWPGVTGGDPLYDEGRKLYTEEINAAARGAFDAGATEVVVMDCHGAGGGWSFNSLIAEQLDRRVEFVVQHEWTDTPARSRTAATPHCSSACTRWPAPRTG
ncbi:MAG: M55 family metallopeptidase [Gaiellales bacterium]